MANKKILIIEDDPDVLQGMHIRLKASHYDIFLAGDTFSGGLRRGSASQM